METITAIIATITVLAVMTIHRWDAGATEQNAFPSIVNTTQQDFLMNEADIDP